MKAGIIAAGRGERLIKGGVLIPKPLIQVNNEPLIARMIRAAHHVGVSSIACIVNDQDTGVADYLRSSSWPVPLELVVKTTPSSMESLFSLAPLLRDEPFLLLTVDSIFEFEALRGFVAKAHRLKGDGALAVTSFVDDEKPLWVRFDKNQKIVALGDKARPTQYITSGFYYFNPDIFSLIYAARAKRLNALREFLGFLLEGGFNLYAVHVSKTIDIDYPEDIKKAQRYLERIG